MSAGIPARAARRKGTSSRRRSVCLPARTTGSSSWESADVSPWPGKCLPTGRIPLESDPFAKAIPRAAAVCGSSEKARSPIAGLRGLLSTSRTGAKFTSIPTARSSAAIAAPTASATISFRQQNREQARAGGNRVNGGSFSRATRPPSWSTAISGRGFRRPEADRISRQRVRTWAGPSMLREKRTTPPTSPSASHRDSAGGSVFPSKPTHSGEAMRSVPFIIVQKLYHVTCGMRAHQPIRNVGNDCGGHSGGFRAAASGAKWRQGRRERAEAQARRPWTVDEP